MPSTPQAEGPLKGLRILEMGQLIAGPFAGQMLASFGAEVVKIEPPGRGDPLRRWRELDADGTSYWWRSIARNKQSLTLDLSKAAGRDIARDLIGHCEVLIENFRPGRMELWGLGPEQFRDTHPSLIYTRVSGYGQTGPYASRPGFASACEGVAGLRHVNGYPGQAPVRLNLSLGDTLAGMHAVIGVLMALIARGQLGGEGQVVDVSIVESVFNMMEGVYSEYEGAGVVREPSGTTVTGIVPTNTYACSDGRYVIIGGNGDSIFVRLMRAVGRDDLAEDSRLSDNVGRVAHEKQIDEALSQWTRQRRSAEVLATLEAADVPAGPVNSIADIANDAHFLARESFDPVTVGGQIRSVPAAHPRLSGTPARTHWAGPELGQHTDAVLERWLNADEAQRKVWREHELI